MSSKSGNSGRRLSEARLPLVPVGRISAWRREGGRDWIRATARVWPAIGTSAGAPSSILKLRVHLMTSGQPLEVCAAAARVPAGRPPPDGMRPGASNASPKQRIAQVPMRPIMTQLYPHGTAPGWAIVPIKRREAFFASHAFVKGHVRCRTVGSRHFRKIRRRKHPPRPTGFAERIDAEGRLPRVARH
jgi:hypothetical protein